MRKNTYKGKKARKACGHWHDIIHRGKNKKKAEEPTGLMDYPKELRGPGPNKWIGHVNSKLKNCVGTFGKVNGGRKLLPVERDTWARENGYV